MAATPPPEHLRDEVESVLIGETEIAARVRELAAEADSTGALIRAHAALLARWMAQSDYRDGSPVTTVLLELAPAEAAVTDAGREVYAAWRALLAERLAADGVPKARAERLALACVALLDGALVQARVERSGKPLETAAAELAALLEAAD